jgi:hypothetical protein
MRPGQAANQLRNLARAQGRPVEELRILYMLESFLVRLQHTEYAEDFVLKGGVLLAAYKLRRPTRDIDMQATDLTLDDEHLRSMVAAVAEADTEDGIEFDPQPKSIEPIRDEDAYSGLRVAVRAKLLGAQHTVQLDISTGDPIHPEPVLVKVPMILGGEFSMRGHPIATVIAEKTVTVLERGATSTRWRDMMDVRNLALTYDFGRHELRAAAEAVAKSRSIELASFRDALDDWGSTGQPKWALWRRSHELEDRTLESFADQLEEVARFIDPVFTNDANADRWDHTSESWTQVASETSDAT